ncbi:MAG: AlkA N-terminal domain-containing protein [Chthonomonadales bacterium]
MTERKFQLDLPPGFEPEAVMNYLGRSAVSPLERISPTGFQKSIWMGDAPAIVGVGFGTDHADISLRTMNPGAGDEESALAIISRILGLNQPVDEFLEVATSDPIMWGLVSKRPALRIPQAPTIYEVLTWAIIGQQINLSFAAALRCALASRCGVDMGDGWRAHPRPQDVAELEYSDLTSIRFSRSKAAYLIDLSRAIVRGEIDLDALAATGSQAMESSLTAIRGIGTWTARYVLLRGAGFHDVVPLGDAGLRNGLHRAYKLDEKPDVEKTLALLSPFSPYRSLATYHVWMSLG